MIYNLTCMIINNFFNKIKGKYAIDNITIMYLFVIIGVGVSSFLLGRLSVESNQIKAAEVSIVKTSDIVDLPSNTTIKSDINNNNTTQTGEYVASKNGKLYYPISCSGAKRIADKNRVWFKSSQEAEEMGYKLSTSCK